MCLGGEQPEAPINKPEYAASDIDKNMTLKVDPKGPDNTLTLQKQPPVEAKPATQDSALRMVDNNNMT